MIKAGINIGTGFMQPGRPSGGVGLYHLHDMAVDEFFDRRETWLSISTWNANMAEQVHKMMSRKPEKIIDVGYSYGCGEAAINFCREVGQYGRQVDLLCLIDPVIRFRHILKPMSLVTRFTHLAFRVPPNVKEVALWRTVNKETWMSPWAREIKVGKNTRILSKVVFGSTENLIKYSPKGQHRKDPNIFHSNIDELPVIHDEIMDLLKERV